LYALIYIIMFKFISKNYFLLFSAFWFRRKPLFKKELFFNFYLSICNNVNQANLNMSSVYIYIYMYNICVYTYESRCWTEKRLGTMVRRRTFQFRIFRHRFPACKCFLEHCVGLKWKQKKKSNIGIYQNSILIVLTNFPLT